MFFFKGGRGGYMISCRLYIIYRANDSVKFYSLFVCIHISISLLLRDSGPCSRWCTDIKHPLRSGDPERVVSVGCRRRPVQQPLQHAAPPHARSGVRGKADGMIFMEGDHMHLLHCCCGKRETCMCTYIHDATHLPLVTRRKWLIDIIKKSFFIALWDLFRFLQQQ